MNLIAVDESAVRLQLERILASPGFSRNERLSRFLRFIVERRLAGRHEELKETVLAGEVLHIPSHVPHKAEALLDTLDVDIFSPPRQDWLDKTDDYLRQK